MIIGLTGGIGSGKSIVARVFEAMGCVLYSSDERAKDMYFREDIKASVMTLLGPASYKDPPTLNRAYIAQKVFSDAGLLTKLNAIIHPAVKQDMVDFVNRQDPSVIIVKETALLFEAGLHTGVDAAILVMAPAELRISRVMARNGISRDEVLKRIGSQWSDEKKMGMADYIIRNDEQNAIIPQVKAILDKLRNHAQA